MFTIQNDQATSSKKPTHVAYHVRDREGANGFWTRIGSAWMHEDEKGFTILVASMPLDGRLVVRVASEAKKE